MVDDDLPAAEEGVPECDPTAKGIVQCLRMLAEEAEAIGLPQTLDALRLALQVCAAESTTVTSAEPSFTAGPPPGVLIH